MTFGAICAATDPVAVVALLKSLGASTGLTMIITGESLLNDGTAMVLFNIFFAKVAAEPDAPETAAEILRVFFRMALGGPALGFALGLVALGALWLTSAPRAAAYATGGLARPSGMKLRPRAFPSQVRERRVGSLGPRG